MPRAARISVFNSLRKISGLQGKEAVSLAQRNLQHLLPKGIISPSGKIMSNMVRPFAEMHLHVNSQVIDKKISADKLVAEMVKEGVAEEPAARSEADAIIYRSFLWGHWQAQEHREALAKIGRNEEKLKALQGFISRINDVEADETKRAQLVAEAISTALGHGGVRGYQVDLERGTWLEIVSEGEEGQSRHAGTPVVPAEKSEKGFINRLLRGEISQSVLSEDQKRHLYAYARNGNWESLHLTDRTRPECYFVDHAQVKRDELGDKKQKRLGHGKGMTKEVFYLILRDTNGAEKNVEVFMITNWARSRQQKEVIPLFDNNEDVELLHTLAKALAVARKNRKLMEKVETLSITDELTRLFNRRHFDLKIAAEIERSKRYQRPLSLAILDIDHFKIFNDTHGHQFGDLVLKKVAEELGHSFRISDVVARYGGEEFAVIMPEVDSQGKSAAKKMKKVRRAIEGLKVNFGGQEVSVTISIGVSYLNSDDTAESLIGRADSALYEAKRSGRNKVVLAKE